MRLITVATAATVAAPAPSRHADHAQSRSDYGRRPPDYFTGRVTITGQFQREAPSRVGGAIVHFEPGARTAWHSHPLGQTLIATEGVGWTQIEGGPRLEFQAGDVMWCPPEHKHWHGATPTSAMTHIAIHESLNGSPVTWMEHVTDAEYLGAPASTDRNR
jgi:quercetin dioxygenase-like cupin family protein